MKDVKSCVRFLTAFSRLSNNPPEYKFTSSMQQTQLKMFEKENHVLTLIEIGVVDIVME